MTSESSQIVRLDVGGKNFATYRSTLTQHGSLFFTALLAKEQDQPYFIDRSPELFALILEALRNPAAPLRPTSEEQSKALTVELKFYGLPATLLQLPESKQKASRTASERREIDKILAGCPPDVNWFAWRDGDYEEQMSRKK